MRILTLPLLLLFIACTSNIEPEQVNANFSEQKTIVHDSLCTSIDIAQGNNIVFRYQRISEDDLDFADDEFFEELLFEIPIPQSDSFFLEDSLFARHTLVYRNVCFGTCTEQFVAIEEGDITGLRIDSIQWDVRIDVDLVIQSSLIPIRIEEPFTKAEF